MSKPIVVHFSGGKKVDASIGPWTITTDQGVKEGGQGSAPEPFKLFLASLATCAGLFAINFCDKRSIPTEGLALSMDTEADPKTHMVTAVSFDLTLPDGFPEKYHKAIVKAINLCFVKKHLENPPKITTQIVS